MNGIQNMQAAQTANPNFGFSNNPFAAFGGQISHHNSFAPGACTKMPSIGAFPSVNNGQMIPGGIPGTQGGVSGNVVGALVQTVISLVSVVETLIQSLGARLGIGKNSRQATSSFNQGGATSGSTSASQGFSFGNFLGNVAEGLRDPKTVEGGISAISNWIPGFGRAAEAINLPKIASIAGNIMGLFF